jgi:hypothetical protein
VKVLFSVQHGFAVYSKRQMLIVGSEEEWLWMKNDDACGIALGLRVLCCVISYFWTEE